MLFLPIFLFLLGLIVGSFLNVLGLRWNSGVGIGGRSFCVVCSKSLKWWELVPVVSFVGLGGRCSSCKTKISWQYPLVELWTGLLFLSAYWSLSSSFYFYDPLGFLAWLLATAVFSIFVVITIYDLKHKIIPNSLVYASILISLVFRLMIGGGILDFLIGPVLFIFFGLIWFITRGRAMGLGDAKLSLAIGLLLGAPMGLSAFVLAFWIGSVFAISLMLLARLMKKSDKSFLGRAKKLTIKSEIPFAPFLVLGAWASLIFHFDLLHVLAFINL